MPYAHDLTDAQRDALAQASDWEIYQAIEKAAGSASAAVSYSDDALAGGWFWGRAAEIFESASGEIHRLVCVEWDACAKLPGLSDRYEMIAQIADVLMTFAGGIAGNVMKWVIRGIALALATLLADRGVGTFCGCPGR